MWTGEFTKRPINAEKRQGWDSTSHPYSGGRYWRNGIEPVSSQVYIISQSNTIFVWLSETEYWVRCIILEGWRHYWSCWNLHCFHTVRLKTMLMPANELCKKVGADCHIPALPHGNVHGKHIHRSPSGLQCLPLFLHSPPKI